MEHKNILDIDWELWIRRQDQPPFFNSLWIEVEGEMSKRLIGGGFSKQLCLRYGADNWWIRSTSDFAYLREQIRTYMSSQSEESLTALFNKAKEVAASIPAYLTTSESWSDDELLQKYAEVIKWINEALFYTTSLGYSVLDAYEHGSTDGVTHYDLIHKECEDLRATSHYRAIKDRLLDRISKVVGEKFGISAEQAASLTWQEIESSLIAQNLVVPADVLTQRETCVYWDNGQGMTFSFDSELMSAIKSRVQPEVKEEQEVKGQVAFKGKVTGTVRIVLIETEMGKVRKGDILVASATNPALLPAMKICGAIVTDEGGIGCHAAIVARELKIPCVIGTKNATHVFKDGDMVEVDAEKGIIKRL